MILRLFDRRSGVDGGFDEWFDAPDRRDLLVEIAGTLGHPHWAVNLVLVDDQAMVELNKDFRQVDGVTDVLSFSYLETASDREPDLPADENHARMDLWLDCPTGVNVEGMDQVAGEIILAPGFIRDRCKENGWLPGQEMPMLVVHGLMHILGWHHDNEQQTEAMQAAEQSILARAALPHPMRGRK